MIQNKQQLAALEAAENPYSNIATVAEVRPEGIRLQLAGETYAGSKLYPYNKAATYAVGDRVHLCREGSTIIVEYPIGGGVNIAT